MKKIKLLKFSLLLELLIGLFGMEFFSPFTLKSYNDDLLLSGMAFFLYCVTCAFGIFVAKIAGQLDELNDLFEQIVVYLAVAIIIAPKWPFILVGVIVYNIIMLIKEQKRSSKFWGFFLVKFFYKYICTYSF